MLKFFALLAFFLISAFTSISDIHLKDKYKDWFVYTALEDGERVCYIVSYPKKKSKHYKTNRKPYIMVIYVDKKADEVSVTSGFRYYNEPVILNIDKKVKYTLPIIQEDFAWTECTKTDQELIIEMKQGLSMEVNGKTNEATTVDDTYSLLGFKKAYQKMHNLCHIK